MALALAGAILVALAVLHRARNAWPEPAATTSTSETVQVGFEDARCTHPYVPTEIGTELEYRVLAPRGEGRERLRLVRARSVRGATALTWSVESLGSDSRRVVHVDRACDSEGAEEPWVALGAAVPGVRLVQQTWSMPRDPTSTRYGGALELDVLGAPIMLRRLHRVVGHEQVEVDAGAFECVRVELEDETGANGTPITAVAWIAPSVGLVRMHLGGGAPEGASYELVSVRMGDPPSGP